MRRYAGGQGPMPKPGNWAASDTARAAAVGSSAARRGADGTTEVATGAAKTGAPAAPAAAAAAGSSAAARRDADGATATATTGAPVRWAGWGARAGWGAAQRGTAGGGIR